MAHTKTAQPSHTCEVMKVPPAAKGMNVGLKTQPVVCGQKATQQREVDGQEKWVCATCLRSLEGIKPRRKGQKIAPARVGRESVLMTEARSVGPVQAAQIALFDVPLALTPESVAVRQVEAGKDMFEVWWPDTGAPTTYSRDWIVRYYNNIIGLVDRAAANGDCRWVQEGSVMTDN